MDKNLQKKTRKGLFFAIVHLVSIALILIGMPIVALTNLIPESEELPTHVILLTLFLVYTSMAGIIISFVGMKRNSTRREYTGAEIAGRVFLLIFYDIIGIVAVVRAINDYARNKNKESNEQQEARSSAEGTERVEATKTATAYTAEGYLALKAEREKQSVELTVPTITNSSSMETSQAEAVKQSSKGEAKCFSADDFYAEMLRICEKATIFEDKYQYYEYGFKSDSIMLPSEVKGKTVTEVSSLYGINGQGQPDAFKKFKNIIIPKTVRRISAKILSGVRCLCFEPGHEGIEIVGAGYGSEEFPLEWANFPANSNIIGIITDLDYSDSCFFRKLPRDQYGCQYLCGIMVNCDRALEVYNSKSAKCINLKWADKYKECKNVIIGPQVETIVLPIQYKHEYIKGFEVRNNSRYMVENGALYHITDTKKKELIYLNIAEGQKEFIINEQVCKLRCDIISDSIETLIIKPRISLPDHVFRLHGLKEIVIENKGTKLRTANFYDMDSWRGFPQIPKGLVVYANPESIGSIKKDAIVVRPLEEYESVEDRLKRIQKAVEEQIKEQKRRKEEAERKEAERCRLEEVRRQEELREHERLRQAEKERQERLQREAQEAKELQRQKELKEKMELLEKAKLTLEELLEEQLKKIQRDKASAQSKAKPVKKKSDVTPQVSNAASQFSDEELQLIYSLRKEKELKRIEEEKRREEYANKTFIDSIPIAPFVQATGERLITNNFFQFTYLQNEQETRCEKYLLMFVSSDGKQISKKCYIDVPSQGDKFKVMFELLSTEQFDNDAAYYLFVKNATDESIIGKLDYKISISFASDFDF